MTGTSCACIDVPTVGCVGYQIKHGLFDMGPVPHEFNASGLDVVVRLNGVLCKQAACKCGTTHTFSMLNSSMCLYNAAGAVFLAGPSP